MKKFNKIASCVIVCLVTVFLSAIPKNVFGQVSQPVTSSYKDSVIQVWLEDLAQESVTVIGDSVKLSPETTRLFTDEAYRRVMYPATYTWEMVVYFIQKQDLKKAFWYMMNLYLVDDKNKNIVVQSFLTYDKLFKMDKVLTNSFYMYVLTDPEIGSFRDGHFDVTAPHVMEKKLNALKEILFYIDKYRVREEEAK